MWWIPAIQAAIGLGQSIYGGIQAGNARKQAEALQAQQRAENEAWFNKEYYSDYTQRADSQNLLRQMRETIADNNRRAEATAAITGATPESVQAQRNAGNKVMADTIGNLAAQGAKYKDNLMSQYLGQKYNLQNSQYNTLIGNAQSNETGMYNGMNQMGSGVMGIADYYNGKSKK
ncbi:MAG: hypothetical protein LBH19_05520 [Dysgonamonadaceae bacterium]|jgi:hypothetical protein|nr:hypothetical protein [Dysgonamonadaceae bacterium]